MITISPVGLSAAATANQLAFLAVITERFCNYTYCTDSTTQPQVVVQYTAGTARLEGTTLFVPIKATVQVELPGCCNNAITKLYNENIVVAFQGITALPSAITIANLGQDVQPAYVNCGRSHGITIYDSLTVTITPAA